MRKPMIAGNWKMNNGPKETEDFFKQFCSNLQNKNGADIMLAPPYVSLSVALETTKGTPVAISSQNVYYQDNGAFTGETSCSMLTDMGVEYVILGHSERRHVFGESNELINLKLKKVLASGLKPVLCVGEKLDERESGVTENILRQQMVKAFEGVSADQVAGMVIAYEPVWAIGTGKNASSQDAESACAFCRSLVSELLSPQLAENIRVLYGGSVKPANISEYMACGNIDGALVGGASLKPDSFAQILNY